MDLWDAFGALGAGFPGRPRKRLWPPDGTFGAATKPAWGAAVAGVVRAVALVVVVVQLAVHVLRAFDDPMFLVLWVIMLPLVMFLALIVLQIALIGMASSLRILWSDPAGWRGALIAAMLSLLVAFAMVPLTRGAVSAFLMTLSVLEIALLVATWPKPAAKSELP